MQEAHKREDGPWKIGCRRSFERDMGLHPCMCKSCCLVARAMCTWHVSGQPGDLQPGQKATSPPTHPQRPQTRFPPTSSAMPNNATTCHPFSSHFPVIQKEFHFFREGKNQMPTCFCGENAGCVFFCGGAYCRKSHSNANGHDHHSLLCHDCHRDYKACADVLKLPLPTSLLELIQEFVFGYQVVCYFACREERILTVKEYHHHAREPKICQCGMNMF